MKKIYSLILFSSLSAAAFAQETLVLQPDSTLGVDALVSSLEPTKNYGRTAEFNAVAWTATGDPVNFRSMLKFDLGAIPAGAVIQSATLDLFFNPTSSNGQHSSLSGTNESVIRRITSSWNELAVTWNTQPSTTTANEVTVPESSSSTQNYSLDVKALVNDMLASGNTNHGFMFQLKTESYYRRIILASSDHPTASLRPRLTVIYSPLSVSEREAKNLGVFVINNGSENNMELLITNNKNADAVVQITDMTGRIVKTESIRINSGSTNLELAMPSLSSGIYNVTVSTDQEQTTCKMIR